MSLLTFFAGLFLGNRLAIGRDKRKERNDAALPIRSWILSEMKEPNLFKPGPTTDQIDQFAQCLPWWEEHRFVNAMSSFKQIRNDNCSHDEYSQPLYKNVEAVREAAEKCLPFTKRV